MVWGTSAALAGGGIDRDASALSFARGTLKRSAGSAALAEPLGFAEPLILLPFFFLARGEKRSSQW